LKSYPESNYLYVCSITVLNIEILNPKSKKLLKDLEELKLISINNSDKDSLLKFARKIRAKKADISLEEITNEVEFVRAKRYVK
jgi:hypothetical protein